MIEAKPRILFITDIDGTLLNSKTAIGHATSRTIERFSGEKLPPANFFQHIGIPIKVVLEDYLEKNRIDEAVLYFREVLVSEGPEFTSLIDGAKEVLEDLKSTGVIVCAATNKVSFLAEKVLEQQDVLEFFSGIYGSDKHAPKPNPHMIKHAMEDFPADYTMMFGDRPEDVISGNLAGATTVFLSGEFDHLLEEESKPVHRIRHWRELLELEPLKRVR